MKPPFFGKKGAKNFPKSLHTLLHIFLCIIYVHMIQNVCQLQHKIKNKTNNIEPVFSLVAASVRVDVRKVGQLLHDERARPAEQARALGAGHRIIPGHLPRNRPSPGRTPGANVMIRKYF
jgi:hypothetical protein